MKLITRLGLPFFAFFLFVFLNAPLPAQLRVQPVVEHPDAAALSLAMRQLKTVSTFMQTAAHPDDEDNALLAMLGQAAALAKVSPRRRSSRSLRPSGCVQCRSQAPEVARVRTLRHLSQCFCASWCVRHGGQATEITNVSPRRRS